MNKRFTNILALVAGVICASSASASVIATLNFDSSAYNSGNTKNGTAYAGSVPYTFNQYASSISSASLTTVTAATGATKAAVAGDGGGTGNEALAFTTPSTGTPQTVAGSSFVMALTAASAVTINSIQFNYNTLAAGTIVTLTYSIVGGGTGSATGNALTSDGNWDAATASFTAFSLGVGQTIDFTATLSGTGAGHTESVAFDNITVNTVPEPITYALCFFGLVFVGGNAWRFYSGRRQQIA